MTNAKAIQEQYYRQTAKSYDEAHSSDKEHDIALTYIDSFVRLLNISNILDVGCGTGRGLNHFRKNHPLVNAVGVEPVKELLEEAVRQEFGELVIRGSGESLPFADNAFDAVCEFAVLHHVAKPNAVVREMVRVARRAVFISDANRFGQGRPLARIAKLLLYKLKLWGIVNFLKTGGKGYGFSEGDGLFYSYSVYDSYQVLTEWADRIFLIPTSAEKSSSWFHPLLTSAHILVCAIKDE